MIKLRAASIVAWRLFVVWPIKFTFGLALVFLPTTMLLMIGAALTVAAFTLGAEGPDLFPLWFFPLVLSVIAIVPVVNRIEEDKPTPADYITDKYRKAVAEIEARTYAKASAGSLSIADEEEESQ